MDTIKVCFIAPKAYALFDPKVKAVFGGAEVDLYFLATELAKDKKFDVTFITADYGQDAEQIIEGVRVFKSLNFAKNFLTCTLKVWYAMKMAHAQIYFQETASWGTFLIALFCRLHRRVFFYRTASQRECDGTYLKEKYFAGKAFRFSLLNAGQIIVQNESDKANFERTIDAPSTVIPNAHRLPEVTAQYRDMILWAGRSIHHKRPELFIKLAQQVPSEHFVMICQRATGDKNYDVLKKQSAAVENLEFIERVPFNEIGDYFQRAKVFVNTSDSEGFPNTYVEACKYATPILSLRINPDNFLKTYKCGLCANDDWGKFVEQFEFLADAQEAQDYGMNGRRYAEEKHDIEKIVEEYKELFFALTDRASSNSNPAD